MNHQSYLNNLLRKGSLCKSRQREKYMVNVFWFLFICHLLHEGNSGRNMKSMQLYHKAQTMLENGGRSLLGARACRCHS